MIMVNTSLVSLCSSLAAAEGSLAPRLKPKEIHQKQNTLQIKQVSKHKPTTLQTLTSTIEEPHRLKTGTFFNKREKGTLYTQRSVLLQISTNTDTN